MTMLLRMILTSMSPAAWLRAAALFAGLAGIIWIAAALIDHGRMTERAKAARQIETQGSKADAAERRVLKCPAGQWNKEAGRCAR